MKRIMAVLITSLGLLSAMSTPCFAATEPTTICHVGDVYAIELEYDVTGESASAVITSGGMSDWNYVAAEKKLYVAVASGTPLNLTTFKVEIQGEATLVKATIDGKSVLVESLSHVESILPAVAPTATQPGLTEGLECSRCHAILRAQEEVTGNVGTVCGNVKSYNPKQATTVTLRQDDAVKYTAMIPADSVGKGEIVQAFSIPNVVYGTYDLVVSKPAQLDYTVKGVAVDRNTVDLTTHTLTAIQTFAPVVGNLNGDGVVDVQDLGIVWNEKNYGRQASAANEPLADLNGDGFVDVQDLGIVWNEKNYGRGLIEVRF